MTIELVCCIDSASAIGYKQQLLFNIKDDLQHFKKLTEGHIVVCGMRTFESIISRNKKPLSNRVTVVLTSKKDYKSQYGEFVFHDVESILKQHKTMDSSNDKKVFIIGGNSVYKEFLEHADCVHLTVVNKHVEDADTYFPLSSLDEEFHIDSESEEFYTEKYDAYYKFVRYTRDNERSKIDGDTQEA